MILWDDKKMVHQLTDWKQDVELKKLIIECVQFQKEAASSYYENQYKSSSNVSELVSKKSLDAILEQGKDIHGIATQREISNVIVFNQKNIDDAVQNKQLISLRKKIDKRINEKIQSVFDTQEKIVTTCSGHFWYPPGGVMSWHTNSRVPGWRMYISFAKEPQKSFFRYLDPQTKEIVTSQDHDIDFRLFRIDQSIPLWHCVSSETDRFSIGYIIQTSKDANLKVWKSIYRKIVRRLSSKSGRIDI